MTQEIDLMTGCIALVHNPTIVTRNIKHFKSIDGLQVVAPYNEILPNSPVRA